MFLETIWRVKRGGIQGLESVNYILQRAVDSGVTQVLHGLHSVEIKNVRCIESNKTVLWKDVNGIRDNAIGKAEDKNEGKGRMALTLGILEARKERDVVQGVLETDFFSASKGV